MGHSDTYASKRHEVPMFNSGDRVFYMENGAEDTGTVTEAVPRYRKTRGRGDEGKVIAFYYKVTWDNGDPDDLYTSGQLRHLPMAESQPGTFGPWGPEGRQGN